MEEILKAILSINNRLDAIAGDLQDVKSEIKDLRSEIKEIRAELNDGFESAKEERLEFFGISSKHYSRLEKRVEVLEKKIG